MVLSVAIDLSDAPPDVITALLGNMSLEQRATCALVCSDWAKAAAATTHSIVKHGLRDLTGLQQWLSKNGSHVKTMQLHICREAEMARLPCAQLEDLLLHGRSRDEFLIVDGGLWRDIAAATKLTSVSLTWVYTEIQQADVVSALTALPDLQQLTWHKAVCGMKQGLSDSRLLLELTKLTSLELDEVFDVALQHLGSLSRLQHLTLDEAPDWAAAEIPGLQQLTALTSLQLDYPMYGLAPAVTHLTGLQQLEVSEGTLEGLTCLMALTALTKLRVNYVTVDATPLQLPALRSLDLEVGLFDDGPLHMSQLLGCTQLHRLSLQQFGLLGPHSLVASSILQELHLRSCSLMIPEGPACVDPWQLVFPGPGRLPHLTSLLLMSVDPAPQQADLERLVACCSGLRVLALTAAWTPWSLTSASAYECLLHHSNLVKLHLSTVTDQQCSSLAQLTGLQELELEKPQELSPVGLRHLARLRQLTSLCFCGAFDSCKISAVLQAQLSTTPLAHRREIVNKVRAEAADVKHGDLIVISFAVVG